MMTDDTTPLAPEAPEPTAPETPAADSTGPADRGTPDPTGSGHTRDERGRFASPNAPDGSTDAPSTEDADADDGTAPAPSDAPDAHAGTHPAPASPPAPVVPPDATADQPFTVRHRGAVLALDGARVAADGSLRVEPAQVPFVQRMLASAREAETVLRPRVAQLEQQVAQRSAEADALGALLEEPDDETFVAKLLEFRQQLPTLRQQAEVEQLRAQLAAARGGPAPGPSQAPSPHEALAASIDETMSATLGQVRTAIAEFAPVTDDELRAALPTLRRAAFQFVREPTRDEVVAEGLDPNEPVFDSDAFVEACRIALAPALRKHAQAADTKRREAAKAEAAARNAARTATINAPPVPGTTVATAASDGAPKTREEYERRKREVFG